MHHQTRLIADSKCISKLARSRPPSVSPNSLDRGLQVHLQCRLIMTSNYISKLTRLCPPSASPNSLNRGLEVRLQTRSSQPRCVFLCSLDRDFQAYLEAGQDRVYISYNEMSIYPGVSQIYTACHSVHLRHSCISECIYIERLR